MAVAVTINCVFKLDHGAVNLTCPYWRCMEFSPSSCQCLLPAGSGGNQDSFLHGNCGMPWCYYFLGRTDKTHGAGAGAPPGSSHVQFTVIPSISALPLCPRWCPVCHCGTGARLNYERLLTPAPIHKGSVLVCDHILKIIRTYSSVV